MKMIRALVVGMLLMGNVFAQEEAVLDATNLDALRAKAGVEVTVEGMVTEIGTTKESTITFINIGLPKKQGFVALIYQKDYPAFPEGFTKYANQKVRVKGLMKLYKGETPQIVVSSPDNITLVTPPQ